MRKMHSFMQYVGVRECLGQVTTPLHQRPFACFSMALRHSIRCDDKGRVSIQLLGEIKQAEIPLGLSSVKLLAKSAHFYGRPAACFAAASSQAVKPTNNSNHTQG